VEGAKLELQQVHACYAASVCLSDVSLTVRPGTVVGLLGRNGMGKTSLIRTVMRVNDPQLHGGEVRYGGHRLNRLPSHEVARLGIGWVPQGRRIFPSLSVLENLTLASGLVTGKSRWTLEQVLELFPNLANRLQHGGTQLSGGEQQMLAIARALMMNPSLLLLDEPSEGLAPRIVEELGQTLLRLKESGLSILLAEQHLGMALDVCDEVYILEHGHVVWTGRPDDLEQAPDIQANYLGVGA
jgi:branched-chain amino acid transport system ATP-binding protein